MITMRMTIDEIREYSLRPGVRRVAVENFLMGIDSERRTRSDCLASCSLDARKHKWNASTVHAIVDGICDLYDVEFEDKEVEICL